MISIDFDYRKETWGLGEVSFQALNPAVIATGMTGAVAESEVADEAEKRELVPIFRVAGLTGSPRPKSFPRQT